MPLSTKTTIQFSQNRGLVSLHFSASAENELDLRVDPDLSPDDPLSRAITVAKSRTMDRQAVFATVTIDVPALVKAHGNGELGSPEQDALTVVFAAGESDALMTNFSSVHTIGLSLRELELGPAGTRQWLRR